MNTIHKFIILLIFLYLFETELIPIGKFSFVCQDPKISYKSQGDTVSATLLLSSAFLGPLALITLLEAVKESSINKVKKTNVWKPYKNCFIGSVFVIVITEFIKTIVKEARPHFLHSCKPNTNEHCTPGALIFEYNCTNTHLKTFSRNDLTRSFPSGHTSLSIFTALYCSYLILIRIPSDYKRTLLKPFLIALCFGWSLLCSLSRIADKRHHWWDVLGGAILGTCCGSYTLYFMHRKENMDIAGRYYVENRATNSTEASSRRRSSTDEHLALTSENHIGEAKNRCNSIGT